MEKSPSILLVEDSEDDAQIVQIVLRKRGWNLERFTRVETPNEFRKCLENETWDVVLCDYRLPTFSACEALKLNQQRASPLPFIVVSGTIGEETAVEMIKLGADDFLLKDRLERLPVAIESAIEKREHRDIREEKEELYRVVFQESGVMMLMVNPENGVVVDLNKKAGEYFDSRGNPVLGNKLSSFLSASSGSQEGACDLDFNVPVLYCRHQMEDGSQRNLQVFSSPIRMRGTKLCFCLVQDISEQVEYQNQLRESLREKDLLLRELHHRVKNNFQIICSLLMVKSEDFSSSPCRNTLQELESRIKVFSLSTKALYRSSDFSKISVTTLFEELIQNLSNFYRAGHEAVKLQSELEEVSLDFSNALNFGIILNELVTNAFKYAFAPGVQGKLQILFHKVDGDIFELSISDSGPGLPKGMEKTGGFGFNLVKTIVEKNGGSLSIESSEKGLTVRARF